MIFKKVLLLSKNDFYIEDNIVSRYFVYGSRPPYKLTEPEKYPCFLVYVICADIIKQENIYSSDFPT